MALPPHDPVIDRRPAGYVDLVAAADRRFLAMQLSLSTKTSAQCPADHSSRALHRHSHVASADVDGHIILAPHDSNATLTTLQQQALIVGRADGQLGRRITPPRKAGVLLSLWRWIFGSTDYPPLADPALEKYRILAMEHAAGATRDKEEASGPYLEPEMVDAARCFLHMLDKLAMT